MISLLLCRPQPILGRCITAMGAKFHPHHLVCHFCLKPLSKGCFKEQENKPYCHPCFIKLFDRGSSEGTTAVTCFF
uniref:LIM zinc-binding domain-containing protein n=1 Tax=Cynoglossus semilaevis TaxID=244447 RepID=A0A3P8VCN0_CYNSE